MQVTVDLVPYQVKVIPPIKGTISGTKYVMPNFLGLDGLNSLKRKNSYNEPCGYIAHLMVMLTVEETELEFIADNEDKFLKALDYLLDAYPSVGWECLEDI